MFKATNQKFLPRLLFYLTVSNNLVISFSFNFIFHLQVCCNLQNTFRDGGVPCTLHSVSHQHLTSPISLCKTKICTAFFYKWIPTLYCVTISLTYFPIVGSYLASCIAFSQYVILVSLGMLPLSISFIFIAFFGQYLCNLG